MTKVWMKSVMIATLVIPASLFADDKQEKDKDKKDPPEMSVEAYDSKTHGALQVTGVNKKTGDWFAVKQNDKSVLPASPPLLNGTVKLAPGTYTVEVNRTQRKIEIEAGKKTILHTGELVVEGKPEGTFWVPKQGKETMVVSNPPVLNRGIALFAGTYTVFVNDGSAPNELKDLGKAEVKPGRKTTLKY